MPKGLTRNSSPIQVSASLSQTADNTFTFSEIDLTLNALDQEVFVVTQLNLDIEAPDIRDDTVNGIQRITVHASLSSTERASVGSIANSNVIGAARRTVESYCNTIAPGQVAENIAVSFDREDPLFAAQNEDYIGIIATSNCYLNLDSAGNTSTKTVYARIYGYRAKMDAAGYAALVQSQVLSS